MYFRAAALRKSGIQRGLSSHPERALIPVESHFAGGGSPHQISYGVLHRFSLLKDRVHLLGNGHFHSRLPSQSDRSIGGEHAFRDHTVHAGDDVLQLDRKSVV